MHYQWSSVGASFNESWEKRSERNRKWFIYWLAAFLLVAIYGGSATSNADSPVNLELSEQFGSTSLNSDLWLEYENSLVDSAGQMGMSAGEVQIVGGALKIQSTSTTLFADRLVTKQRFARTKSDLSIKLDLTVSDCNNTSGFAYTSNADATGDTLVAGDVFVHATVVGPDSYWTLTSNSVDSVTSIKCEANTPTSLELLLLSEGGAKLYVNGSETASASGASLSSWNLKHFILAGNSQSTSSTRVTTYDNILIRNNAPVDAEITSTEVASATSVRATWVPIDSDNTSAIGRSGAVTSYVLFARVKGQSTWVQKASYAPSVSSAVFDLGESPSNYEFRVASVNSEGSSLFREAVYHIITSGQSLSMGWTSLETPTPLSTVQPYKNVMFDSYSSPAELIPLVEPARGSYKDVSPFLNVESMSSGMANTLTSLNANRFLVSIHSIGGTAYSGLKQGTTKYKEAMSTVRNARALLNNQGLEYSPLALTIVHGENDERAGATAEVYAGYLKEWQKNYQDDVSSALGKSISLPLFTTQMTSFPKYNHSTSPNVALGQLLASRNQPNEIYLVTPNYIFDYSDGVHLKTSSYRRMGEYFGKVMNKVLFSKEEWKPLQPTKILIRDNVITAKFHVPEGQLTFDTSAVMEAANYGFDFNDSTNSATIVSKNDVRIVGTDTVQITLSGTPTGSNPKLGYARKYTLNSYAGAQVAGAPKGNLRDTDPATALNTTDVPTLMTEHLYNWSVVFNDPIQIARRITYRLDGASGALPIQSDLAAGDTFILPNTVFSKTGYNFKGWKTADGSTFNAGATVTVGEADLVLTANFELKPLRTITYLPAGGTGTPSQPGVREDSSFRLADGPTRNGYSFTGWSDGTSTVAAGTYYTVGASNVVLTAQWSANRLSVTYDEDGGSVVLDGDVYVGQQLNEPATPIKNGYTFTGWYTAATGGTKPSFPYTHGKTADFTLFARWTAQDQDIVYHSTASTSGSKPNNQTAGTGQLYAIAGRNSLTRDGYSFVGWNSNSAGTGVNYNVGQEVTISVGGLSLYPRWSAQQQTITYRGNGAESGTVPGNSSGLTDDTIFLANSGALVKPGFTFGGWNTNAQGTGRSFISGSAYTIEAGGLTLYAVWNAVNSGGGGGATTTKPNDVYVPAVPETPVIKSGPQVQIGGVAAELTKTVQSNSATLTSTLVLQVHAEGSTEVASVSLTLPSVSNASIKDSVIEVASGTQIAVAGDSALPGSRVEAYVFSSPQFVGAAIVDTKGNYNLELNMPDNLASGNHTLQLGVVSAKSKLMVLSTPIKVKAPMFSAYFAYGSKVLPLAQKAWLEKYAARYLETDDNVTVRVRGYSPDSAALGALRAKSVAAYLKQIGLKATYILKGSATGKFRESDRRADVKFQINK